MKLARYLDVLKMIGSLKAEGVRGPGQKRLRDPGGSLGRIPSHALELRPFDPS